MCLFSEGLSPCSSQDRCPWSPDESIPVSERLRHAFEFGCVQLGGLGSKGIHRDGDVGHGNQSLGKASRGLLVCASLATGAGKACWKWNPGFIFP